MAVYTPQQLGITIPKGQEGNGNWIQGRMIWNGTLSEPGFVHPESGQVGAGQAVSKEVIAQTNPANVAYVNKQRQQAGLPAAPTTAEQVSPYLNAYQDNLFQAATAPEIKTPSMIELKTALEPKTALPAPLNRTEKRASLISNLGVADLEKQLTDLKTQTATIESTLQQKQFNEEGKPVPMGVISGRQTEEARQAQIQLDTINRQKAVVIDELNTKYSLVNTYMSDLGLDYQDAVQAYDKEFSRNIQVYDLFRSLQKDAITEAQRIEDNARANLGIYINAVTKGNLTYATLPADQKLMLNKLEIQSGLPAGFISSLRPEAKANIVHISDYQGKTQVLTRNADGSLSVNTYGTGGGAGAGLDLTTMTAKDQAAKIASGIKIADSVDKNYVTVKGQLQLAKDYNAEQGKTGTSLGDKLLSAEEARKVYNDILAEVGDPAFAQQVFNAAMAKGGFQQWTSK